MGGALVALLSTEAAGKIEFHTMMTNEGYTPHLPSRKLILRFMQE